MSPFVSQNRTYAHILEGHFMKRFSILIYCVDIVRVVSFGQTLQHRKEGHFELYLRERDDYVVNKPSISLVSARKRQTPQRFASVSLGAF